MEDIIKQCKSSEDTKQTLEQQLKLKEAKLNELSSSHELSEQSLKQMREKYDETYSG